MDKTIKEKYEAAIVAAATGLITEEELQLVEQEYRRWVESKPTSTLLNG